MATKKNTKIVALHAQGALVVQPEQSAPGAETQEGTNVQLALEDSGKFSYAGFPEDVQETLHRRVARLTELGGTFTRTAVEMGKQLAEAQKEVTKYRDGGFQQWVRMELGITEQYAYMYINLYGAVKEGKINLTVGLSNTVLLAIAQPSVSDEAREAVVAKAQAGERVTVEAAKEVIKADKVAQSVRKIEEAAKKKGVTVAELAAAEPGKIAITPGAAARMKNGAHKQWFEDTELFAKSVTLFYGKIPGGNDFAQFTDADWVQAHKVLNAIDLIVTALRSEDAKRSQASTSKK